MAAGESKGLIFVVAMFAGMVIFELLNRFWHAAKAPQADAR